VIADYAGIVGGGGVGDNRLVGVQSMPISIITGNSSEEEEVSHL
jgi:hypothetical protein